MRLQISSVIVIVAHAHVSEALSPSLSPSLSPAHWNQRSTATATTRTAKNKHQSRRNRPFTHLFATNKHRQEDKDDDLRKQRRNDRCRVRSNTKKSNNNINNENNKMVQAMNVSAALCFASLFFFFSGAAQAADGMPTGKRYWSIMEETPSSGSSSSNSSPQERVVANEALLDYAVGTINTMFYDKTGGADFTPTEFYGRFKLLKRVASSTNREDVNNSRDVPTSISTLSNRDGAVQGLQWLVSSLQDPFSKYLTREDLRQELESEQNGFLGVGAVVEPPQKASDAERYYYQQYSGPSTSTSTSSTTISSSSTSTTNNNNRLLSSSSSTNNANSMTSNNSNYSKQLSKKKFLSMTRVSNLPVVTAVAPDSPAERAGLVVGDRIVAVGDQDFLGWTRFQVAKILETTYNAEHKYFGNAELTIAKPVYSYYNNNNNNNNNINNFNDDGSAGADNNGRARADVVIGYRQTRVRLPTKATEPVRLAKSATTVAGGDSIVHYELLTSASGSIFDHLLNSEDNDNNNNKNNNNNNNNGDSSNYKVGYIRLTRFSKASTTGYVQAVEALEGAGAQSYILDLRNNYGGVIQEAMLTASTLLRDPHAILCYIMNSRGGFTPHDVEEYVVDKRFPGYLLSSESKRATRDQVQRENPAMFVENGIAWDPPSAYASLHEQVAKRGIRRVSDANTFDPLLLYQVKAQKKIVVLINEGTASAAEVFVAALHDNARTVALLGTKSYGKGLIQHTFPMPDGGGLRLTVAEYLTPSLRHVTHVGGARFDRETGEFVGGGIRPDIFCESKQGIPGNIQADLCVAMALDALEEAKTNSNARGDKDPPTMTSMPSQVLVNHFRSFGIEKP